MARDPQRDRRALSRRAVLRSGMVTATAALLAACNRSGAPAEPAAASAVPVAESPTPPSATPTPSPTPTPTPTSTPTPAPTPSATPTPAPSPAPSTAALAGTAVTARAEPIHRLHELMPAAPANAVALTIDDGPDSWYTPQVLKLLARYDVLATFCVIGVNAAAYPDMVSQIADAGHAVCHHSMTHPQPFAAISRSRLTEEIARPIPILTKATGQPPRLFRPPGGGWSAQTAAVVAAYDMVAIDWDVDPRDWTKPGTATIVARMLAAQGGDIMLCHDGGGDRSQTVRALATVLPTLLARGLTFVPLTLS